jgi:hypothetical protein
VSIVTVLCWIGVHRWRPHYRWRERTHPIEFFGLVGETHQWYEYDHCTRCHAVLRTKWSDWRQWCGHLCWVAPIAVVVGILAVLAPLALLIVLAGGVLGLMLMFGILWACT